MHALRLNGAGSIGSALRLEAPGWQSATTGGTAAFSRVDHHPVTWWLLTFGYLLVATSKCTFDGEPLAARCQPSWPGSLCGWIRAIPPPQVGRRGPSRLPGAALAFERGTECNDRSVV